MGDSPHTSTSNTTSDPTLEPGHYGAGYGEQVPEDAAPQLGPATDGDPKPTARGESAADSAQRPGAQGDADVPAEGDEGEAVVFTPADVHARPPDRPPTEAAPESEKAGLIFERS